MGRPGKKYHINEFVNSITLIANNGITSSLPEYSLNASSVHSQHFLGQSRLYPWQLSVRITIRLHLHDLVESVAKHRGMEYRLLQHE